eukprot:440434_1
MKNAHNMNTLYDNTDWMCSESCEYVPLDASSSNKQFMCPLGNVIMMKGPGSNFEMISCINNITTKRYLKVTFSPSYALIDTSQVYAASVFDIIHSEFSKM